MDSRAQTAFGALVLAQLAHSIEEYAFRLFDVFGPTRRISGLFSRDLARGGCFPGVGTAPLLIGGAIYLGSRLTAQPRST